MTSDQAYVKRCTVEGSQSCEEGPYMRRMEVLSDLQGSRCEDEQ